MAAPESLRRAAVLLPSWTLCIDVLLLLLLLLLLLMLLLLLLLQHPVRLCCHRSGCLKGGHRDGHAKGCPQLGLLAWVRRTP